MTDTQHPTPADESSLLAGFVKGGAVTGMPIWAFILLSFLAALGSPSSGGLNALGPLLAVIAATPTFLIFVLSGAPHFFRRPPVPNPSSGTG